MTEFPKTIAAVKAERLAGWKLADAILVEIPIDKKSGKSSDNSSLDAVFAKMAAEIAAECHEQIAPFTLRDYRLTAIKFPPSVRLPGYPMASHVAAGSIDTLEALISGTKKIGVGKNRRIVTPLTIRTMRHAHNKAAKARGEKPAPITETIAAELARATALMGDLARVSELARKLDNTITEDIASEFKDEMIGGYLEMIEEAVSAMRSLAAKLKHGRKRAHLTVVA